MSHRKAIHLHTAAARRGPQFITVTWKIVEDSDKESHDLLLDLVKDGHSDDRTVSADIIIQNNS